MQLTWCGTGHDSVTGSLHNDFRKAVTMQHTRARRVFGALLTVLIAVLVGLTVGASAASARDSNPHHHGRSAPHGTSVQDHKSVQHGRSAQHGKSTSHVEAQTEVKQSVRGRHGTGLDGLDALLNSIINGTIPKLVNTTVPTAVDKTVKTTTAVVKTTTGVVTKVVDGTQPSSTPTPPTSTTPSRPTPSTKPSTKPSTRPTIGSDAPTGIQPTTAASDAGTPPVGQQVQQAPLEGPNLVAATSPAPHRPTTTRTKPVPERVDALAPASLLTAPGTGMLIGVVIVFGLGVFVVVYGAGYRGRRVH